jgi:hypothetical protein
MELAMFGKWMFPVAILAWVVGVSATIGRAELPWSNLLATSSVEADPAKEYVLKEEHGPWIIIACSFNGENAPKQARDLVLELRRRYRVEAFVHRMDFKLDDPNGHVQPIFASPRRHQYRIVTENPKAYRDGAIKEIAVVVGNFPAIDDPEAQRALQKLKASDPDCLKPERERQQARSLADWRSWQAMVGSSDHIETRKLHGPLSRAFVTRNPLLPEDYFVPKGGIDELVLQMNKNVKHCLLDCPGKYTVQVAHFTGEVILNQNDIRAIESGAKRGPEATRQGLAQAAEKAHELTEALRMKGYDAYEFHDRYASLVTVGSFDSVGTPRPDGKIEINPQVHRIIELFRARSVDVPGEPGAMKLQSLVGIFFDAQPIPVEVPKRSISQKLARPLEMAGE